MEIREVQIDGFGVFSARQLKGLSSGLNIIYGPNEFGKTTLLEFIRCVLFGFPGKNQRVNQYTPVNGGRLGGGLKCVLASGQLISIDRQADKKDGPIIRTDLTENQGESYLNSLLGYATKEVFKNLYAFTIDELHDIQSLRGEEIKNRIYGVGMGLGDVSLGKIEQEIDKSCLEIFKPRGQCRMREILGTINNVEKEIMQVQKNLGKFNELNNTLSQVNDEKTQKVKEIDTLTLTKKLLETQQELFPVVVEVLIAEEEVSQMKTISNFPEDGMHILSSNQLDRKNLLKQIKEEEQVHEELKIKLCSIVVNDDLLACEGDVLFLQQSLNEIQSVIKDELKVKSERRNISAQIIIDLNAVGQGWTEEQISEFELSELEKKEIQEYYNKLSELRQNESSAKDKLNLHQEQKITNKPETKPPLSQLKRVFPYALIGVGVLGLAVGGILVDYIILGTGLVMVGLGALFRNKILIEMQPEEETEDNLEVSLVKLFENATKNREGVFKEWSSWLGQRGLDRHLSPLATEKIGDKVCGLKVRMVQRESIDERLDEMSKTIGEVSSRISKVAPFLKNFIVDSNIPTSIQVIYRHFDETRVLREKKENLEAQLRGVNEKINTLKRKIEVKNGEMSEFLRSVDVVDEESFIEKNKTIERQNYLDKTIAEKKEYIQLRVGLGDYYHKFIESVKASSQEENHQKLDGVSKKLSELNIEKDQLLQTIGETKTQVDYLVDNEDMSKKQTELEIGRQKIRECGKEWAVGKIALYMLDQARKKYEKERQPEVIKSAEEIFGYVTQRSYSRIFKPMDSDDIFIVDENDQVKGLLEMSRGTREQLYLALRFGLIEEFEKRSEPLPLVMDDIFVNFDEKRNNQMLDKVLQFSQKRQVIVLTCHKGVFDTYSSMGANPVTIL
jgi:uncharacterized protein YhaN